MEKTIIALPKGPRLLSKAYKTFKKIGYTSTLLESKILNSVKNQLEFECDNGKAIFLLIRVEDVPKYIDNNWANIGVSAFDCYSEYELTKTLTSPVNFETDILPDLNFFENSKFCIAGTADKLIFYKQCVSNGGLLRIATRYPNICTKYFLDKGIKVNIVTVNGSLEVMPKFAKVDAILDIVESGKTLEKNNLFIYEEAMPIKTNILVNKTSQKEHKNTQELLRLLKNSINHYNLKR